MIDITIQKGSITGIEVDAIVNPANSFGYMGGGVALVIKKVGGDMIEEEAIGSAPIHVGSAVATTGGDLKCKRVIHASTMEEPAERIRPDNVRAAMIAALECAEKNGLKIIAVPGMGTGVGRVNKNDAAKEMIRAIRDFDNTFLTDVILIDIDDKMVKAWQEAIME